MKRSFFFWLGVGLVGAAAILLAVDLWAIFDGRSTGLSSSEDLWLEVSRDSFTAFRKRVEWDFGRGFWGKVVGPFLSWPAVAVAGAPGVILALGFWPQRRD